MKTIHSVAVRLAGGLLFLAAGILSGIGVPLRAEDTGRWHYDSSFNVFMAGLSGDTAVRGIPASVNASFGDIVEALEFSAAGRFTATRDRWSISTEVSYMGLGGSGPSGDIDLDQWLVEPTVGYWFSSSVQGFAGVRYNSISADLSLAGPLGHVSSGTKDWFDPIVGFQCQFPFGQSGKWTLDGRFDVGGFGVGSDLTWQIFPYLNWKFSDRGSLQLGWRWLGTDYEDGRGTNRFLYDVVVQGPQMGVTLSF